MTAASATTVQAMAPVRLDLAGGWTDVAPFSAREGGEVVTAAIGLYARAFAVPGGSSLRLVSEDLHDALELPADRPPPRGERLALLSAAVRLLPAGPLTLTTRSDAPPGSGLGSSGALDVALVAALCRLRGEARDADSLAGLGCQLEQVEAGVPGGRQDQYAAALGGFQHLVFRDPDVRCERLELDSQLLAALEQQLVVCYMGASRFSGSTIARVMASYERGDPRVTGALHTLKEAACAMVDALRAGDLARIGTVLRRNWAAQQELDPGMCTPEMARLARLMDAAGALGGKAAGSGAGGSMFFLVSDRSAALDAARSAGVQVLPVRWESNGARAW
jgi:D-glycero-alpha-D-manno-heptose-7-phosphate kinase